MPDENLKPKIDYSETQKNAPDRKKHSIHPEECDTKMLCFCTESESKKITKIAAEGRDRKSSTIQGRRTPPPPTKK